MSGVNGGNPDLEPEEAVTSTLGVVWTSRFSHALVSSLQISLDWYHIEIDEKIARPFIEDPIQFCYDARYNADFSPTNQWCTTFERDPDTGEIDNFRELDRNAYNWETSGIDMQVDWRSDLGPGQVGVSWFVSWVDEFTTSVVDSSAPPVDRVGVGSEFEGVPALPEWKSYLHLSYAWRDLTVGAGWRYIDGLTDTNEPEVRTPSVDYFSLDAGYEFSSGPLGGLRFDVGVENLTDQDPPILATPIQANTDPSQYDVFGRRYYASLRYSF